MNIKKIICGVVFLITSLVASENENKVVSFIKSNSNSNVESITVKKSVEVDENWKAYLIEIRVNKVEYPIEEIFISNGTYITQGIFDIEKNQNLRDIAFSKLHPTFNQSFYKKENLVFGKENAKNKLVVFTDPFCPNCIEYINNDLFSNKNILTKKDIAIYFYSIPIVDVFGANEVLIKAIILYKLENKTTYDTDKRLYNALINNNNFTLARKDQKSALNFFNDEFKTKFSLKDLEKKEVVEIYNNNINISKELRIKGTPTVFYNNYIDITRTKFLEKE